MVRGPISPLPLTVLTGFLGSGKTTLLTRLLRDPDLADTVVIINEFGEVGLDHLLVETVDDDMILLSAGCLCCSVRGDLVATLEDLLRRRDNGRIAPFRRVIVETTGLADPAPVIGAVLYHPYLSLRYAVASIVTTVDALHGLETIARHPEALRQVAVADRLIVTKTDLLADETLLPPLLERLRGLNPGAATLTAVAGDVRAGAVIDGGLFDPSGKIADVRSWLNAEQIESEPHRHHHGHGHHAHRHDVSRHDDRIRSFVLTSEAPLRRAALDMFLELVRSQYGPRLLRIKGLVALAEDPGRPIVIHGVQHVLHVPAVLSAWPDADRRTRLVFIVEDVEPAAVAAIWNAFAGRPEIDRPDAAALLDNPLAPATLARP